MKQQQVKVEDLTDVELKAVGYDLQNQLTTTQQTLQVINNELASRAQKAQSSKTMEEEVKEVAVEETVEESTEEVA